jgi:hypothetical protein
MTTLPTNTSRRHFIQGCALTAAGFAISKQASYFTFEKVSSEKLKQQAQVVVYQDKAHFDNSGLLAPYKAPASLASSTRQYVKSIDSHTFLSRHWFV